jgi:hypothetical protein
MPGRVVELDIQFVAPCPAGISLVLLRPPDTIQVLAPDLGGLQRISRTIPLQDDGEWSLRSVAVGGDPLTTPILADTIPEDPVSDFVRISGMRGCADGKGAFEIEPSGRRPPDDPEASDGPPAMAPAPVVSPRPAGPSAATDEAPSRRVDVLAVAATLTVLAGVAVVVAPIAVRAIRRGRSRVD